MQMHRFLAFIFLLSVFFVNGYAHGQPLPFSFTGTVAQTNFDPADPFAGSVQFGTVFSGSYVFNGGAADALLGDPKTGSYNSSGSPFRMTVDIGGRSFTVTDVVHIGIANDYPGPVDQCTVLGRNADGSLIFEIILEDTGATVFSGDTLPVTPLPVSNFSLGRFTLTANNIDGNYVEVLGDISSLALLPPTILSVSPGTGFPGSQVTITGDGFVGTVQVFFNGVAGVVQVIDEHTLIVTVPPLLPGLVEITITASGGSATAPPGSFEVSNIRNTTVPTLSEWGLLLVVSLLLGVGLLRLRARQNAIH